MRDFKWSRDEKAVARAAYDTALAREMGSIREEVEAMLRRSADPFDVWEVHDFLSAKRREVDEKYDLPVLRSDPGVARLLREGWLRDNELAGLSADKLEVIRRNLELGRDDAASRSRPGS